MRRGPARPGLALAARWLVAVVVTAVGAAAAAPPDLSPPARSPAPAGDAGDAGQPVVRVWPGVAPGSESWTQQERTYENTPVGTVVQNVVTPTLTVFLPDPAKATGTGIVVAPGGAFIAIAISREGTEVARWLQARGIAAFVLKYRTVERREGSGMPADQDAAARPAVADAVQALAVVRQHAGAWHLRPERVGILGFSAGGMVASGTLLQEDGARRPTFAALVYGAPFGAMPAIPPKLPPVFLAWAQDDPIARRPAALFAQALEAAGARPEMHVYASGGHGFGMQRQGTSSDHWPDDLLVWLGAQGLTRPAVAAAPAAPSSRRP